MDYGPWSHKELHMTEQRCMHTLSRDYLPLVASLSRECDRPREPPSRGAGVKMDVLKDSQLSGVVGRADTETNGQVSD